VSIESLEKTSNLFSTDDPMLWNQSFGFEEALISCSEKFLMRPEERNLENQPVKLTDINFTRYVIKKRIRQSTLNGF